MAYSEKISNKIKEYLQVQDWGYTFDEIGGMFTVEAELSCKLDAALVVYQVTEDGFLCYTTIMDDTPLEMIHVMGEYLHRANYGLPNGNFELDYEDGSIHFKTYFDCPEEVVTEKQLSDSMAIGLTVFDHYGNGIYKILHGTSAARELIAETEEA